MNETLKVLRERRSIRSYKKEQVREEDLNAILDAGTWAASAMGKQPAVMVVLQDPDEIAYLSKLNARVMNSDSDPFYGAPTVVVVLCSGGLWLQDGSLVMANLMNAAQAVGVGSCWINRATEVFESPEGKELLRKWGLPEDIHGVANCILGYADGPAPEPKPRKEGYIIRR